jgi:8-oxo-dGTP diphosphatase
MPQAAHVALLEVVAGIIWRQGRLLAARRPKGRIFGGYWEFPGGKAEPGESMQETLIRELREEVSIKAETTFYWKSLVYEYPHGPVLLHFLHVTSFAGEAKPLENQELRWVSLCEALEMNFLPPDILLLKELADTI